MARKHQTENKTSGKLQIIQQTVAANTKPTTKTRKSAHRTKKRIRETTNRKRVARTHQINKTTRAGNQQINNKTYPGKAHQKQVKCIKNAKHNDETLKTMTSHNNTTKTYYNREHR